MRTLKIGGRKLSDMKPEEFVDFIYDFGFSASDEFWNKPILTEFEYDEINDKGAIYFTYYQLRKEDGLRREKTGHIFFGDGKTDYNTRMGMYESNNDKECSNPRHPVFDMKVINHFLKLGFDLPLYSE